MKTSAKLIHPHIVTAFDAGADKGVRFLAMSYVEGVSLEVLLKGGKPLPERQALTIARQVADALRYSWDDFKLLHRDIKPANIMLDTKGRAILMDMGIAKCLVEEPSLTVTGSVVGTPYYISPEQARADKAVDHRADIYSLGATLFHAVTGTVPFDAPSSIMIMLMHVNDSLPSPRERNPRVTEPCAALLTTMMAKSPEERQQSWDAVVHDLDLVLKGNYPITGKTRATFPSASFVEKFPRLRIVICAMVAILALALVVALFAKKTRKSREADEVAEIERLLGVDPAKLEREMKAAQAMNKKEATGNLVDAVEAQKTSDGHHQTGFLLDDQKIAARVKEARTRRSDKVIVCSPNGGDGAVTLLEAFALLRDGMTLRLKQGTYDRGMKGGQEGGKLIVVAGKTNVTIEAEKAEGGGLVAIGPVLTLHGCAGCVVRNVTGTSLALSKSSGVTVVDSYFKHGVFLQDNNRDVLLHNCHIAHGMQVLSSALFSHCDLFSVGGEVMRLHVPVSIGMSNCILGNLGLVKGQKGFCMLRNCAFFARGGMPYGMVFDIGEVMSGNTKPVELCSTPEDLRSYFKMKDCLTVDPRFKDFEKGDYRLMDESPCKRTASDGGDIGVSADSHPFSRPWAVADASATVDSDRLKGAESRPRPLLKKLLQQRERHPNR